MRTPLVQGARGASRRGQGAKAEFSFSINMECSSAREAAPQAAMNTSQFVPNPFRRNAETWKKSYSSRGGKIVDEIPFAGKVVHNVNSAA